MQLKLNYCFLELYQLELVLVFVKLSFGWKKKPTNPLSSSGVEISIMLRDTVLPTAVRDVVTNSFPSSAFISAPGKPGVTHTFSFHGSKHGPSSLL